MSRLRASVPGLVLAMALLWALPGTPALGQSLLSEAPGAWRQASPREEVPAPRPLRNVPLGDLMMYVDLGRKSGVFDEMQHRLERELGKAQAQGRDVLALHELMLWYMMRAGENTATAAELEEIASTYVDQYPDGEHFPLAFYMLNLARFRQGKPLQDSFFFDDRALATLPPLQQTRYHMMRVQEALDRGRLAEAAAYRLEEMEAPGALNTTVPEDVLALLRQVEDPAALDDFLARYGPRRRWLRLQAPFLRLTVLMNAGRYEQAQSVLEDIRSRSLARDTEDYRSIYQASLELRRHLSVQTNRIGVLLPLSSGSTTLRQLSQDALDGIRMALLTRPPRQGPARASTRGIPTAPDLALPDVPRLSERGANGENGVERRPQAPARGLAALLGPEEAAPQEPSPDAPPPYELIIRDTANDPARAAGLVRELAQTEQVVAIVGPLAREESEAAARAAEEEGVPLIAFSVTMDVAPESTFVFRHSKSQEDEVRDLVRYAMDYRQLKRFALLYPQTDSGRAQSQIFWDEVARRGGRVTAVASYPPFYSREEGRQSLGFKEIFEDFTGVNRPLPAWDRRLLELVGDEQPDPIVDFDALFLPIGPGGAEDLRLIAPYPVTVDAEDAVVLGNRFWNDNSVIVATNGHLDGAVFVDSFDRSRSQFTEQGFHVRHRSMYGHRVRYQPPSYYTGLGYDTVGMVLDRLRQSGNRSRKALRDALHEMAGYSGVTGWTSFQSDGTAVKESMFFEMQDQSFVRLQP